MQCAYFTLFLACLASNHEKTHSAKILGIFAMPAPSHFILGSRFLRELAARGHEVTMISMFPQKTKIKNYNDVVLSNFLDELLNMNGGEKPNLFEVANMSTPGQLLFNSFVGSTVAEMAVKHTNVQKLLNSKQKFDLVIAEWSEIYVGFAHKYNCSYILLSTIGSNSWINGLVSNPSPYSYVPDLLLQYSSEMNFFERLHNVYYGILFEVFRNFYYLPKQDVTLHQYFPDAPPLMELMDRNLAMILLNSYPAITDPVPHVPSMVEIGGFHVEDPKTLPKDLQDFMDSAKEGVILFSMGSNLKSADLLPEKRDALLNAFSKLKQKVIWKWEEETLPGQSSNVKLMKWLPQNDIMAHPTLKVFITHAGLLSITEAIYHGVPIVCIPIFGDQKMNAAQAVLMNYGVAVYYEELTEEKLTFALNEVLNNPKYRENIKKRSGILRDQPLSPIDNAMFWVEHVLRNKGAEHFKSAGRNLHWIKFYLLDVIAFTIVIVLSVFLLFLKLCMMCFCGKNRQDVMKDITKKKE